MATTSYFSFTNDEKEMIHKMLQLSAREYQQFEKNLDALLDTSKMCDEHQLAYLFYDDRQFYCPKCLIIYKPQVFHYVEELNQQSMENLDQELRRYQNCQFPQINFKERAQSIRQQLNINQGNNQISNQVGESQIVYQQQNSDVQIHQVESQNSDVQIHQVESQNSLIDALEKRRKFVEVQKFISYISIEKNNRKVHDDMHTTDEIMRPKLESIIDQSNGENNFDTIFKKFLRNQQ
ncbi:unnamed protein product [Paramecium pentaurelia]|uniref:Uncharacterized protein n=1 Tax=Paramecium pentaurelia TaxID=43138 RepID=A0A8S1XBU8_9CILI|nr:unnamed protein product [Paramecium pentaurelia]